jgi:hypothetical protein
VGPVSKYISRRYRATKNFAKSPSDGRLLLYQMGKVGSTALAETLLECGKWVLHVHSLNAATLGGDLRGGIKANETPAPSTVDGFVLARILPKLVDELRVITLIRDPVARDLSEFFQSLSQTEAGNRLLAAGDYAAIRAEYLVNNTLDYTLGWFDFELSRFLGIDIYALPFDPEKGTAVYRKSNINLILLKSEIDTQAKALALSRWLEIDSLSIQSSNVSKDKTYGDVYRRLVTEVQLPNWLVEKATDSRFTRHFYSEQERNAMVLRWTRGANER